MAGEPKVSKIHLDEATRARIVKELGLGGGLQAVPEEIVFEAIEPPDRDDVRGHGGQVGFINPQVIRPVGVSPQQLATGRALRIVTYM